MISSIRAIPLGTQESSYILEELGCLSPLFINDRSKSVTDKGPVARKPWQSEEPLTQSAWPVIWPCTSIPETCHTVAGGCLCWL